MITFKDYFTQPGNKIVAIFPGAFKPPHKGHFEALNKLMENATEGIVYIGNLDRDNITAEQSFKIWNIYKKYFNKPVNIEISAISPVESTYKYVDRNLDDNNFNSFKVGVGNKGGDVSRYKSFKTNTEKYARVEVVELDIEGGGISGTLTRELLINKDNKALDYLVPDCLNKEENKEDKNKVRKILDL